MPRVTIPDSAEHITDRVYALRPEYAAPALAMKRAVKFDSILGPRTREAVRYRIAQINGCLLCQGYRANDAREDGFSDEDYASIADPLARQQRFYRRDLLAVDYAERFITNHHSLDDEYFEKLHKFFTDPEIVDLTFFIGRFLAFGRLTHVLGLDDSCDL